MKKVDSQAMQKDIENPYKWTLALTLIKVHASEWRSLDHNEFDMHSRITVSNLEEER
ncbi:MAG: hypothetical protein FD157_179 [Rhodocyclaceae bacterium]|nr:MAG: hypothetical protein FD157_179 [Rhodocyclaceae bacterium]TND03336.1 MAG: hypothetical protein FD118_1496 [Rhodocyclaceae bacterium]